MIAARVLQRAAWEAILRDLGCKPLEGLGPLNTAEWWVTEWGFLFTVPSSGPNGECGEIEIGMLVRQIEGSRTCH